MSEYIDIAALLVISIGNIYIGSKLNNYKRNLIIKNNNLNNIDEDSVDLTLTHILIMPISSSIVLILLFYYFAWIQYGLIILILVGSFGSLQYLLHHIISKQLLIKIKDYYAIFISIILSLVIMIEWIRSGSFICHDIIGSSLAIVFISLIRFPSLKLAYICLFLLLVYDIYWVFLSKYHFHENVMLEVARKSSINPIKALSKYIHISVQESIELPIKLLIPHSSSSTNGYGYSVLGLGDITLPGLIISYACELDSLEYDSIKSSDSEIDIEKADIKRKSNKKSILVFYYGLFGYFLGLLIAFYMSKQFKHAQPALLYLVPLVLSFISLRAYYEGRFSEYWNGKKPKNTN